MPSSIITVFNALTLGDGLFLLERISVFRQFESPHLTSHALVCVCSMCELSGFLLLQILVLLEV